MTPKQRFILTIFILASTVIYGQNTFLKHNEDTINMTFKDTIFNIAIDSFTHNLGNISSTNHKLVKYFKYVGTESIVIKRILRNGEPTHICEYPLKPLIPNKIYSLTFCFQPQGSQGSMTKVMTFELSDGNHISFAFSATYLPITTNDK